MLNFDSTKTCALLVLVPDVTFGTSDLAMPDPVLDPIAWNAVTAYVEDDEVYYDRKIYLRAIAGTTATAPDLDDVNWVFVRLCNRYRQFDPKNSSQTLAPSNVSANFGYRIIVPAGSTFDTLAFDNVTGATSIRVRVYDNTGAGAALNDNTITVGPGYHATLAWARRKTFILHAQDGDDPLGSQIQVDVTKYASEVPGIGSFSLGLKREIGVALVGFEVGIVDRSVKEDDGYGELTVTEGPFTKRMSGPLAVDTSALDAVCDLLADYRAEPTMWMATGGVFGSTTMLGYFKSFTYSPRNDLVSFGYIDVEGI
jgi:hypothetical protein